MSKFQELIKQKEAQAGKPSSNSVELEGGSLQKSYSPAPAPEKSRFLRLLQRKATAGAQPDLPPTVPNLPSAPAVHRFPLPPLPAVLQPIDSRPRRSAFPMGGWLIAVAVCSLVGARLYLMFFLHPALPAQKLAGVDWNPEISMGGELFPSYIIAISTLEDYAKEKLLLKHPTSENPLGDPWGLVGVQLKSPEDNAKLSVTVAPNLVMNGSTDEVILPKKNTQYVFYPRISYNYQTLLKLQQQPVSVDLKLQINGQDLVEKPITIQFASINDCPFMIKNNRSENHMIPWMYAAYVDENSRSFDKFYREAFDSKIVNQLDGYGDLDKNKVRNEVFAIWYTLQKHGFKYSDVTTTSAVNDFVSSQRIRFVDQSLGVSQANCADGSILFASILHRIGLHTDLILVPGHMFLSIFLGPNKDDERMFLETTMLGNTDLNAIPAQESDSHDNPQVQISRDSFLKATIYGAQEYRDAERYTEISVEEARDLGIKPISP